MSDHPNSRSFHAMGNAIDVTFTITDRYTSQLDAIDFKLRRMFGVGSFGRGRVRWELEQDPMGPGWRPRTVELDWSHVVDWSYERPLRPREILRLMRDVFMYEWRKAIDRPKKVRVVDGSDHYWHTHVAI